MLGRHLGGGSRRQGPDRNLGTNEGEDPQREAVNGAFGVDGDIRIADEDGFFTGRLADGKNLGQYIEVKKGESQVLNVELTRK